MGRRRNELSARQLRISAIAEYYAATSTARIENKKKRAVANTLLNRAVKDGMVERLVCAVCGDPKSEGHHEDYDKPLEVVWLCVIHHRGRHKEINLDIGGYLARYKEAYAERKRRESGL